MLKKETVIVYYVINGYNVMFDRMDGAMRALAEKRIQLKEDMVVTVKLA
jgi:hypothetical protein